MRIDLHNHTSLCNHAEGSVAEFVAKAKELGIDVYGFSDHAPMNFDTKYRMGFEDMARYKAWIEEAKEADIEILYAYEVDYIAGYIDERVLREEVDYLIGSVHFLDGWGFDNPEFIGHYESKDIDAIWHDYFDAIRAMAKSGHFNIVGHLDLIKVFKFLPKKDVRLIAKEALKAIKKHNMVIEINSSGFRKPIGEQYPSQALLEEAYALDIPIAFSSDAHHLSEIGFGYEKARDIAKAVGYSKASFFRQKERIEVAF